MALQYLHVFNPKLVNEFRFGADLEHVPATDTLTNTGFTIESLGINGMKVGVPMDVLCSRTRKVSPCSVSPIYRCGE